MAFRASIIRKTLITGALVAGTGFGAAGIATAATGSSSSTSSGSSTSAQTPSSSGAPMQGTYGRPSAGSPGDPAAMSHGPNETLLTGTDLQKADAAATAAVPGATIVRAETDSSGAAKYEVHMKKSDGTYVTVQLDSNFKVTNTVSGFCAGPAGEPGHGAGNDPANGSGTASTQA